MGVTFPCRPSRYREARDGRSNRADLPTDASESLLGAPMHSGRFPSNPTCPSVLATSPSAPPPPLQPSYCKREWNSFRGNQGGEGQGMEEETRTRGLEESRSRMRIRSHARVFSEVHGDGLAARVVLGACFCRTCLFLASRKVKLIWVLSHATRLTFRRSLFCISCRSATCPTRRERDKREEGGGRATVEADA